MTTDAVGGVWDYALELCRGLVAAEVEVVLAVMGPPPDADQRRAAELPGVELVVGPYKLEWQESPWDDVARAGDWLLGLEARLGCDLVHLNGYAHGAVPFRAPKLVVGHSCVLSWWRACKGEEAPASFAPYRAAVAAGLQAADFVVAPSASMLASLDELYGPLPRTEVIPNGRDPERFRAEAKEPFVLAAGRLWDEAKNAASLARVASRLPWPVKIAGARAVSDAGTAEAHFEQVELLGRLPSAELAALFARAAIYALPARYEPFGLTVLEAALSGCALVLGDIPSLRENWRDAALFVRPDDSEALGDAIWRLSADPALRAQLGAAARHRALEFSAARMQARYLDVYRTLRTLLTIRSATGGGKEIWSPCAS